MATQSDPYPWSSSSLSPKQKKFLTELAKHGQVKRACKAAKLTRASPYRWRAESEEFAAFMGMALQWWSDSTSDELEDVAFKRARDGYLEPVYHQGVLVGRRRVYDHALMLKLLAAAKPEKYREKKDVQVSGTGVMKTYIGFNPGEV